MAITIRKKNLPAKAKPEKEDAYPPGSIANLSSFIKRVIMHTPETNMVKVYRGHPRQDYLLKPSVFREKSHRKDEKNILRELITVHPSEFSNDKSVFEQLVRMQHYALETRLLDITFNPLVALYFAANSHPTSDGHFISLTIDKRDIKYYDSDAVSCVANLSNLTASERNILRNIEDKAEFNECEAGLRLLQFIRSEKPYFLPIMEPDDLKSIFLVKPKQNNRRILAQQGGFFIFGLASEIPDDYDDIKVIKTHIPAKSKKTILRELDLININAGTLFPEVEYAAKYIMSKLTPATGEDG